MLVMMKEGQLRKKKIQGAAAQSGVRRTIILNVSTFAQWKIMSTFANIIHI